MRLKLRFPHLLFLMILSALLSCRTNEKYGSDDEKRQSIFKAIKRSRHSIFLSYQLPDYRSKVVDRNKKVQYHIKARKLERRDARLALAGLSTKNYAILERIEEDKTIRIDSVSCNHGELMFLKLPQPVQKGNYNITAWGCRFGRHIDLVVD